MIYKIYYKQIPQETKLGGIEGLQCWWRQAGRQTGITESWLLVVAFLDSILIQQFLLQYLQRQVLLDQLDQLIPVQFLRLPPPDGDGLAIPPEADP